MKRSLWIKALCICYLACFGSLTAIAQSEYPTKPVKIIVPFPPGGTTDLMARISAEQLTKILKQAFVIENVAGGGGVIGADRVGEDIRPRTSHDTRRIGLRQVVSVAPEEIRRRGAEPVDLDTLLARSDVVSLHCPRDETTLRMMNAQRFAQMKRGALFITTARGGIHDEQAF